MIQKANRVFLIWSKNDEGVCAMSTLSAKEYKRFEDIKRIRPDGSEYWAARELAPVLDYAKWENFYKVIKRAMIACENSGRSTLECFPEVRKTSPMPNGGVKDILDYELSRYACYLIVQNGDPRKEVIALGQTYFAIQTYRQEVADRFNQLDEDSRRLVVRGDIKQWNQLLAETARNAGVITAEEFAIFQNAGYMGLYGGMTVDDIHRRKGLAIGQKILDYMGSTELIANLFRISQTEEKLRKDQVSTSDAATAVHYAVGNEVREAIRKIDGTMPEDLPTPEKSIAQLEREQMERLKQKAIDGQLILDE
jgi:DNA-damage-inducible protein D